MTEQTYEFIKFIVSVLAPLMAGYLGIRYGLRQIRLQKRIDLVEAQLNKFYSPILGLQKEIRAKGELRVKIEQLGEEAWKEESAMTRASQSRPDITPYQKKTEYNNKQLKEEAIPAYNKMLEIFRKNYWLAEPETKKFYPELVEFVEIWNRHLGEGLPPDVADKINHTEKKLKPFYDELENRTDKLRKEVLGI